MKLKVLKFPNHSSKLVTRNSSCGFTLIEILIVVSIMAILALVSVVGLQANRGEQDLNSATRQVVGFLRQAESQSQSGEGGGTWGVYFANATNTQPFYAFISSSTYSTATVVGYNTLPATVAYLTSTLASGATLTISFASVTGAPLASASVGIYLLAEPSQSSTISVASTGVVSY
jgi:prepilin-type N-terminal cleavage/methylation domain-containing protein